MELPPLARGKETCSSTTWGFFGITPARAGKSWGEHCLQSLGRNYPRSRGEKATFLRGVTHSLELPPLARGKVGFKITDNLVLGITPARAGKSSRACMQAHTARNYPRSRGEKSSGLRIISSGLELPPLARGKEAEKLGKKGCLGITPARAGKSQHSPAPNRAQWNYPRSRGEKKPLSR